MLMAKHDPFLGNIKSMIANILGMLPEQVGDDDAFYVFGDDQILTNTLVEVRGTLISTREGHPFTQIDYIREVDPSEVAEKAAEYGLDQNMMDVCFPNGLLSEMIEAKQRENQIEAGQAPAT